MEFAFSSLWAAKVLQSVRRYMFKLKYVQALPGLFQHRVTFRNTRKKRIETAILMVELDHLEPATSTSMYIHTFLIPSTIAVENHDYVWRVCRMALLIMILYPGVYERVFIGTAIRKAPKTS